jgi:hypothetical protein
MRRARSGPGPTRLPLVGDERVGLALMPLCGSGRRAPSTSTKPAHDRGHGVDQCCSEKNHDHDRDTQQRRRPADRESCWHGENQRSIPVAAAGNPVAAAVVCDQGSDGPMRRPTVEQPTVINTPDNNQPIGSASCAFEVRGVEVEAPRAAFSGGHVDESLLTWFERDFKARLRGERDATAVPLPERQRQVHEEKTDAAGDDGRRRLVAGDDPPKMSTRAAGHTLRRGPGHPHTLADRVAL